MKIVLSKVKLHPRPAMKWPGTNVAVPVDKRVSSKVSCRGWLSAYHAVPVDVVVVIATVARGRESIMTVSAK